LHKVATINNCLDFNGFWFFFSYIKFDNVIESEFLENILQFNI